MRRMVVGLLVVCAWSRLASAEEAEPPPEPDPGAEPPMAPAYPEAFVERPLVLPAKMLEAHGVLRINLTADSIGSPIWIAPSAAYGVIPKLQVGFVFDPGLCLLGERDFLGTTIDECEGGLLDEFAFDGLYQLVDKPEKHVSIAGHARLGAATFDPMSIYLRAGVLGRYRIGSRLALYGDPALRLGLSNRDKGNKEVFELPVQLAVQATGKLALFFETGLLAPLSELTDSYYVSLGAAGLYAISANLDVGVRFSFPRITGGVATGSNASADTRQIDLFVTYRR